MFPPRYMADEAVQDALVKGCMRLPCSAACYCVHADERCIDLSKAEGRGLMISGSFHGTGY